MATKHGAAVLSWAGAYHNVGARLLREYAALIGLQDSFTILDRADSEDLVASVRHELGLDATESRFPTKATCLSICSRVVINSDAALTEVLERAYPWCAPWEAGFKALFAAYVRAKQARIGLSTGTWVALV